MELMGGMLSLITLNAWDASVVESKSVKTVYGIRIKCTEKAKDSGTSLKTLRALAKVCAWILLYANTFIFSGEAR